MNKLFTSAVVTALMLGGLAAQAEHKKGHKADKPAATDGAAAAEGDKHECNGKDGCHGKDKKAAKAAGKKAAAKPAAEPPAPTTEGK